MRTNAAKPSSAVCEPSAAAQAVLLIRLATEQFWGRRKQMKRLDGAIGWFFVVLGTAHNFVAAPLRYPKLDSAAMWYVSGGMMMWLMGAMNLLRLYHGEVAPGLRSVCFAANLVVTIFSIAYAAVTGAWRNPPSILLLATCVGAMLMSVLTPSKAQAAT